MAYELNSIKPLLKKLSSLLWGTTSDFLLPPNPVLLFVLNILSLEYCFIQISLSFHYMILWESERKPTRIVRGSCKCLLLISKHNIAHSTFWKMIFCKVSNRQSLEASSKSIDEESRRCSINEKIKWAFIIQLLLKVENPTFLVENKKTIAGWSAEAKESSDQDHSLCSRKT